MSINALTGLVPEWYTPESEKESSDPAKFYVKPLDTKQIVELQKFHKAEGGIEAEGLYRSFELSVSDWDNVNDAQGKKLKCTRTNFKVIPVEIIAEVGAHAIEISFATEDDEKN